MSLQDDLRSKVNEIFGTRWTTRDGTVVPAPKDLSLGNDAVKLDAAILYADLNGSTKMVDSQTREFSAEIYKSFLHCAGQIIKAENGMITAYDGDRVMAVYIGDNKRSNAARTALKIQWAVANLINPGITKVYASQTFKVRHVVGVDFSPVFVARTGVWGNNDLVWVGPAANYAAKLTEINEDGYYSYVTDRVYSQMNEDVKKSDGKDMWESRTWTAMNNMSIYRSSWGWVI